MTEIIAVEEVQVIFDNDSVKACWSAPPETGTHYVITIRVKILKYDDGIFYYDIGYKYKFVPGDLSEDNIASTRLTMHPFYQRCSRVDNPDPERGEIIMKNKMTEEMVAHLMMDDATLAKFSGNSTPQRYRTSVMECISLLWD